jgi:hypothetical protein
MDRLSFATVLGPLMRRQILPVSLNFVSPPSPTPVFAVVDGRWLGQRLENRVDGRRLAHAAEFDLATARHELGREEEMRGYTQ